MKNLILAAVFTAFGILSLSAQTTPQKRMDTTRPDTTRNNRNMGTGNMNNNNMNNSNTMNNNWDKSRTDTTNWKNKDGMKSDRKMKKKNNR